jgi:hypothetical protein
MLPTIADPTLAMSERSVLSVHGYGRQPWFRAVPSGRPCSLIVMRSLPASNGGTQQECRGNGGTQPESGGTRGVRRC